MGAEAASRPALDAGTAAGGGTREERRWAWPRLLARHPGGGSGVEGRPRRSLRTHRRDGTRPPESVTPANRRPARGEREGDSRTATGIRPLRPVESLAQPAPLPAHRRGQLTP